MTTEDPWAPDSGARFDRAEPTPFDQVDLHGAPVDDRPAPVRSRRRREVIVAIVATLAVGAGLIASIGGADDPPDAGPPGEVLEPRALPDAEVALDEVQRVDALADDGGDVVLGVGDVPLSTGSGVCLAKRLPGDSTVRWATDVEPVNGDYDDRVFIAEGLALVTTHEDARSAAAAGLPVVTDLAALDLGDGTEAWRTSFFGPTDRSLSVRGSVGDVIVVEFVRGARSADPDAGRPEGRVVVGIEANTGEERWSRVFDRSIRIELRDGAASFLAVDQLGVSSESGAPSVSRFDIATSSEIWTQGGELLGVTDEGDALILDGGDVLIDDVRVELDGAPAQAVVVAGSTLVVQRSPATFDGVDLVDGAWADPRPLEITGAAGITPPDSVDQIESLGGSAVLVIADGAVYGANVSLDTIELRWRRGGELVGSEPSDRGRLVALAPASVSRFPIVVDGSTGRTIFSSGPDTVALSPAANGLSVVEDIGGAGLDGGSFEIGVVDLDGRPRWSVSGLEVPGVARGVAAGDRVVVGAVERTPGGIITVTAWGSEVIGPATCGTVLREWVVS